VLPDINVLATMARHYIYGRLKDKALTVLKEIEEGELKEGIEAHRALLLLYMLLLAILIMWL
jgi:hypothetical protein